MTGRRERSRASQRTRRVLLQLEAFGWVAFVRATLWLRPYQELLRFCRIRSGNHLDRSAGRVLRAVRRAARLVPGASCLTQALTAQILLARRGVPSVLHLGVNRTENGVFGAHAWLEIGGVVVMGGDRHSLARYSRIVSHQAGPAAEPVAKPGAA